MNDHKFDIRKLEKLNNPERLNMIDMNKLINEMNLDGESTLVDVGAGTGIFAQEVLNILPKSKCYALDISQEMIDWMNQNRTPLLENRLIPKLMSESKVPLDDDVADLVFMITVHHELDNADELLSDIYRVLKQDKYILICDWKEDKHHHFVKESKIIEDLNKSGFRDINKFDDYDRLVCFMAKK